MGLITKAAALVTDPVRLIDTRMFPHLEREWYQREIISIVSLWFAIKPLKKT